MQPYPILCLTLGRFQKHQKFASNKDKIRNHYIATKDPWLSREFWYPGSRNCFHEITAPDITQITGSQNLFQTAQITLGNNRITLRNLIQNHLWFTTQKAEFYYILFSHLEVEEWNVIKIIEDEMKKVKNKLVTTLDVVQMQFKLTFDHKHISLLILCLTSFILLRGTPSGEHMDREYQWFV